MKTTHWIILAIASLSLTACDGIVFPGFSSDEDTEQTQPPPPTVPASTPVQTETPEPVQTAPATQTGATETIDETATAPVPEDEVAPETGSDTGSELETGLPATETTLPPLEETVSEYAGIDNLLSINTIRCAPTTEEASLTFAEIAGARAASASVVAQAVNGTEITTDAFPGIVKMEPKRTLASGGISSGHCGATRIANNWFITASHCLDDTYDEIELISTQSSLTDPRAVRVKANGTLCHAAYGGAQGQYSNDVALVSISDEAAEAFSAVPIARFGATDRPLGSINYPVARMAGWGLTNFIGGELSNTLLTAELNMVSSGPAVVTVSSRDAAGPCIGDSGGPLMIDEAGGAPKVIGVLSVVEQNPETGEFCKGQYNARYTNLQGYTDWIEAVIGVCTNTPELCAR